MARGNKEPANEEEAAAATMDDENTENMPPSAQEPRSSQRVKARKVASAEHIG